MSSANTGARRRPTARAAATSIGIKNPVIDKIIDLIIFAKNREDLVAATRALDRVLLWNYYMVPALLPCGKLASALEPLRLSEKNPDYGIGFPTLWWWDEEKAKKVAKE